MSARLGLLLLILTASGCASFTHGIRPEERHDAASAYVYGRFHIAAKRPLLALGGPGHDSIGFEIQCRNGNKYTIGFSDREPLQVIKVVPSKCQLETIVYTDGAGMILGREKARFWLLRKETLRPGGVYYVGDFSASAETESTFNLLYTEFRTGWSLAKARDRYQETTDEMRRAFPGLTSIPTRNRMMH